MPLHDPPSLREIPQSLEIEAGFWEKGFKRIAGVDEAGRGPLAGPVTAAAVIFEPGFFIQDVKDSKQLNPNRRSRLYKEIIRSAIAYGIGWAWPREIDRINIRQATFSAMNRAVAKLEPAPDKLIVDGYEIEACRFEQESFIKGDNRSFTIAAASILAKVARDELMIRLGQKYPQYGFERHKGYGTAFHRQMILIHGQCPWHRKSFLKNILNSL